MSSNQQQLAPKAGTKHISWEAVTAAISSGNISSIQSVAMPYLSGGVTVGQFINQISAGDAGARDALDGWMSAACTEFDMTASLIHLVTNFAKDNAALMKMYGGPEEFKQSYPAANEAINWSQKRARETESSLKTIREKAGFVLTDILAPQGGSIVCNITAIHSIAWCLNRVDISILKDFVNSAVYRRLLDPKRRIKERHIASTDWRDAKEALQTMEKDIKLVMALGGKYANSTTYKAAKPLEMPSTKEFHAPKEEEGKLEY